MADIEIEIDGKKLTAKPNQTVIQVADEAGIYIPRFCYHKHLSIPANCRMCLVEVEKAPKAMPACATPVMAGMKVFTRSQKTLAAQRAVMEFLLINHPLDCPICDQGGECELQDLSMGYGASHSHYDEDKRSVPDQNLGPLIATEMTRCIYCTRCVRFGDEIAGLRELGAIGRGEFTEISTYIQHAMQSEVSGNIIDLCPVGALTSKPYRFTARPWELDQAPSISPHDCVGSNIYVHTRYGKVMRVVSREQQAVNETWIADRDRFSYTSLYHRDRLEEPIARIDGKWQTLSWQAAFELIVSGLQEVIAAHGSDKIGALASPNSTLEEFFLLQKLMRALGTPHIDHRLREIDTRDQALQDTFPGMRMPLPELENCTTILLVGADIQREQPIAALRIRKAALKGALVAAINPVDYAFNFNLSAKHIVAPHLLLKTLVALAKALGVDLDVDMSTVVVDEQLNVLAQALQGKQKVAILIGALALHDPRAADIRYVLQKIAQQCGAEVGLMTDGANSAGGWIAGAIPHRHADGASINHPGLSAHDMLAKPRKAYVLLNVEPDLDCANSAQTIAALKQAKFITALSIYRNPVLESYARVILPMTPFTETAGTFINVNGLWQSFKGVAKPEFTSRPAWKILRVLGNFFNLPGFEYESAEEVRHEIKSLLTQSSRGREALGRGDPGSLDAAGLPRPAKSAGLAMTNLEGAKNTGLAMTFELTGDKEKISRIGEIPMYATDSLVRRAQPLQAVQQQLNGELAVLRLHPETAQHLKLQNGDLAQVSQHSASLRLPVKIDVRIAKASAFIAGGIEATVGLGDLMGEVLIERV